METLRFIKENARWLLAGTLLTFMSSFGQTFFISIFAGEIRTEFGLSHSAWGSIYAAGTLVSAVVMVWSGALTDKFRIRQLGTVILLLLSLSCLLLSQLNHVWLLPVAIFALRITGQGMSTHMASVSMARWFVATRGRALSISSLGIAIGNSVLPIGFVALMAYWDWRSLWAVLAFAILFAIPLFRYLLKLERSPKYTAKNNTNVGMNGKSWTRGECMKHWLFWLAIPFLIGPAAFVTSLFFQQVHYVEIKGWGALDFVAMLPLFTAVSIGAMILSGLALDRFGAHRLMPFIMLPISAAFVVFGFADTPKVALIGFVFLGLGTGSLNTLPAAFWAEFYGTTHLGAIKAMAASVMVLGSAIGPALSGWLIDSGVGLEVQFYWIAGYFVLASVSVAIGVYKARPLLTVAP